MIDTLTEPINLETIFCKNPQSYSKADLLRCSSTRQLFLTLKDDCKKKEKESRQEIEDKQSQNQTVEDFREHSKMGSDESVTVPGESKDKEDSMSSVVDLVVIGLLVVSAVVSLVELYKERVRRKSQAGNNGGGTGEARSGDRRMSLVDLTVSRHARKRESQQMESLRVNNNVTGVRPPPPLLRRMSFPAQMPEIIPARGRHPTTMRQQSWCASQNSTTANRKMSIDYSEDDSSPDRRRVRIIRRH